MPASQVLQFGSSLSIREVSEQSAKIKELLDAGPLELDLTRLEGIDTAGLQLVLATAVVADRRGQRLKLRGAQALRTGAARALGLEQQLFSLVELLP